MEKKYKNVSIKQENNVTKIKAKNINFITLN